MLKQLFVAVVTVLMVEQQLAAQVIHIKDAGDQSTSMAIDLPANQQPNIKLRAVPINQVRLINSLFLERYQLNRKYMMSLDNDKLLQNFYLEAGINKSGHMMLNKEKNYQDFYWGWESPSSELRGHFLGHYLSAAAYMYASTGDMEIKNKADYIVSELAECQKNHGGEWAGSIPENYFELLVRNKPIWSPQYTIHKTLMGLYDMYTLTGSQQALNILDRFADWFHRWTGTQVVNHTTYAIYSGETSGMLEIWANLYRVTKKQKYIDLMQRYSNPGLFQALLKGEDALSNDHANASIPWSHGAAAVYEVTGDTRWRNLTLAFWKNAVDDRESFCTGGQNAGEFWIPPHQLNKFIGQNNQEHCTVYNMMRTAEFLLRWTGDMKYADYIEKNLYNGILAQQNPNTGMVAYFLPMGAGYRKGGDKGWGDPTMDFWCCDGTMVQAQSQYAEHIYFENQVGLVVSQYIPSQLRWEKYGVKVNVEQDFTADQYTKASTANRWNMQFKIKAEKPVTFALQLRLPGWLQSRAVVKVNGIEQSVGSLHGLLALNRTWNNDEISVEFPTKLYTAPLPNTKNTVAYMEGPIVLAGVVNTDVPLKGDIHAPESILIPEYGQEYKTVRWKQSHYRTTNQRPNIRFMPLYEISDEAYTIYFPVTK